MSDFGQLAFSFVLGMSHTHTHTHTQIKYIMVGNMFIKCFSLWSIILSVVVPKNKLLRGVGWGKGVDNGIGFIGDLILKYFLRFL